MNLEKAIETKDGVKVVDSRKVHEFLGVKTPHSKWILRQIESLSLENGKDYLADKNVRQVPHQGGTRKVTGTIFYLTQRASEHIGMAERNETGTQIRDAFIKARDAGKKLLESELERKSKDARKGIASEWARHGLHGRDFAKATIKEYDVVFNDKNIRKPQMDNRQKAILSIFELTEMLKLERSPQIKGIDDVCYSMEETGRALVQTFSKLRIERV